MPIIQPLSGDESKLSLPQDASKIPALKLSD